MKICLFGKHKNRTPLAYEGVRNAGLGDIVLVDSPLAADYLVFGFSADIRESFSELVNISKENPKCKFVVISEEPLWDTLWSGDWRKRSQTMKIKEEQISYYSLNHMNSSVFEFDKIPYFLLTDDDFYVRYRAMLTKNLREAPAEVLGRWEAAKWQEAYFTERRVGDKYNPKLETESVFGLCELRSRIAEVGDQGAVLKVGKGWGDTPARQLVPDWHLEKLTWLSGRVFKVSALENTHVKDYISEKIFDAFAVGAFPIYCAGKGHRIFDLVPASSFVNLYDSRSSEAALNKISKSVKTIEAAYGYLAGVESLAAVFASPNDFWRERQRVVGAIRQELSSF